jgi:two-component sensor histidine kinase
MSFVNNDVPVFLTIRNNKTPRPTPSANDLKSKILVDFNLNLSVLRSDFKNCSSISESLVESVKAKSDIPELLSNKLDFIFNELIENIYKYSADNSAKDINIKVYKIAHTNSTYQTYVISLCNLSNRKNVKGIIRSFKMISKEFTEKETFQYDKGFFQQRGHMGWITITKLNTMVHVTAEKRGSDEYGVETQVLLSSNNKVM